MLLIGDNSKAVAARASAGEAHLAAQGIAAEERRLPEHGWAAAMGGAGESSSSLGNQTDDSDDFEQVGAPADRVPVHGLSLDEEFAGLAIETADETVDEADEDEDETASGRLVVVNVKRIEVKDARKHAPRPRQNKTDAWKWNEQFQDFVQRGDDDKILRYTVFQRPGENLGLRDPNEDPSDLSSVDAESDMSADDSGTDAAGPAGRSRLTRAAKRRKLKKLAKERNRRSATVGPGGAAGEEPDCSSEEYYDSDDPGSRTCAESPEVQLRLAPRPPQYGSGTHPETPQALPLRGGPGSGGGQPSLLAPSAALPPRLVKPPAPYDEPLDSEFSYVESPRRFFQVGRIFMTVWFEAESLAPARTQSSFQWYQDCPAFRGTQPFAGFRWFVVVRRKTTHSLCLSIHNRAVDGPLSWDAMQCVLHSSLVEPAEPSEGEPIVEEPIPVVVEHKGKFISPLARVDLSRIYTVEHNLKVMKLGYVPKNALATLEKHYRAAANV